MIGPSTATFCIRFSLEHLGTVRMRRCANHLNRITVARFSLGIESTLGPGRRPRTSKGRRVQAMSSGDTQSKPPKFTNLLIKQESPYLLQHAHNPVGWDLSFLSIDVFVLTLSMLEFGMLPRLSGCLGARKLLPRPKKSRSRFSCLLDILPATGRFGCL